ncbi:MAG TPA: hypothetical protein PKN48_07745 [Bacteroidales bacterium]|nr:hypothetical protein [Bacteroidales bacterium]
MKKSISAFVIIMSISLICGMNSFAQKKFKGIILYSVSYSGTIDPATAAQLPKSQSMAIYENKQKTTTDAGGIIFDVITDGDAKTRTTLIDAMGQKMYYKESTEEINTSLSENGEPVITYKDETKTIAGYTCKKAEYTVTKDGESYTSTVYYTEELGGEALNFGDSFNKLKGVPLESSVKTPDGWIITTTATEVKKGKVKDTDLLIPADYIELSPEQKVEIMNQLKGGE